jgi:DNA primase
MSRIAEESIERVAAANDIVDVIGSYFPLKRAGSSFRALCPFHREKSPSFHVHPARQSFHCFGCGAGGGVFRFVMDYEHVDFPTAVQRLAERAGIRLIESSDPQEESRQERRSRLIELHRKLALWYHHQLLRTERGAVARDYLKGRGMNREIAVAWQLGYAPGGWHTLESWANKEGFSLVELQEGGLLSTNESGEQYDRFRHRLMFPIRNDYGDIVGFSGRTLEIDSSQEAKYINSPETLLFNKGRLLFGLDKSKRAMIEAKEAIVMEGQIDLIAAFEHGCHNVVAPQGTAFTAEQARLLRRFVERVVLCFDSDTAGNNAAERSLLALLGSGFEVRLASLPPGEDPDSLIRKEGIEAFQKIVTEAGDFFEVTMERAFKEGGGSLSPRAIANLAQRLARYLPVLSEEALREATASQIAARLGISVKALIQAAPKAAPIEEERGSTPRLESQPLKISPGVELLCRLVLTSTEVREWLQQQRDSFSEEEDQELLLVQELLEHATLHEQSSHALLLSQLSPTLQRLLSSWDIEKPMTDPLSKAKDTWNGLRIASWKRRQAAMTALLKKTGIKNEEIIKIQKEILDLQRIINELA